MNAPWFLITATGAVCGYTVGLMLKRGHLTVAGFWGVAAALLALVWWACDTFDPPHSTAEATVTALCYAPTVLVCAASSLRAWRQDRRPGWYGGQHERIDNP